MNTTTDNTILDCGHTATPQAPDSCTTGRAVSADGRTICFACADNEQRAALKTNAKTCAYVSSDGKTITTWTGGKLGDITCETQIRSWRASRWGDLFAYSIVDVHGQRWYGRGSGRSMFLRIKRCAN